MYKNLFKKGLSILLCLMLLLTYLPAATLVTPAAEAPLNIVPNSKKADPHSIIWEDFFGPNIMHTEFSGAVWTDKSVFAQETDQLPGITLKDENNFLTVLSSIASNLSITGHTSSPTDTMLVLDLSGSMVNGTYAVGYVRDGNSYNQAHGIDMSLMEAMIEATNSTIDALMKQNSNNRVGVVLYSGNSTLDNPATPGTATVVLPLDRYSGVNGSYLSLDATYVTNALYAYNYYNRRWYATGEYATYVPSGNAVSVSVEDNLTTEKGNAVRDSSKVVNGGTYTQNGLYQAMNQFLAVTDTTVPEGNVQAGAERMPVIVLMTDGAPTIATTSYSSIGTSNTGDGGSTNNTITFLTQLTAAYVRGMVAAKYQESASDDKNMLFMTLGLGTENSSAATDTLYPSGSNSTLREYWNTYLNATPGSNVSIIPGKDGLSVSRSEFVTAMNYVDKYFYASDAAGLIDSFSQILGEIQLKAESYSTMVESSGANFSGYVTFEDALGEMIHVHDMKGVLMNDGSGSPVLYTGKGLAKSLNEGILGTQTAPTERGRELVMTVKERITGTTTTQAQQLISWAHLDDQLYYTDESNFSNYIGWYADAQGNYIGFWDKDSGYENAPANAAYANRSYIYLGAHDESDMMHVVVLVRTDLTTLNQTVFFKIPAALLPTVQYRITLNKDDPSQVDDFIREDAIPMQLVFETGLRSDVNSLNLEQKIAEHIAAGGHIHRNADGSVTFYTNEWAIGNDKNQNGIPDAEEVETAIVAQSHFHPALDNTRYYYTEDTPILDASGNPITDPNAVLSGTYHIDHHYYTTTQRVSTERTVAEATLAEAEYVDGRWVIPGGTMFRELVRLRVMKTENPTQTLEYSRFSATFAAIGKQDVYSFLGNNGSFTVAPATGITLRKELSAEIPNISQFTFQVRLSNIPAGTEAVPALTDANGNALADVTMSAYENGQFTVTMPANITAYISGIPVGTSVEIAEQISGDYKVVGITVAGQTQSASGNATVTIPAFTPSGDGHHQTSAVDQMVPVVITNGPNTYGNLIISKDVFHSLPSDPAALASKTFTFRLTLTGDNISEGDTFETSAGTTVQVGQNGETLYTDGSPIVLKNEESVTILGIPEGAVYTVTEDSLPGFSLDSIGSDSAATAATGAIIGNASVLADFYNRYPDKYVPVELPITVNLTKLLSVLSGTPADEDFVFVLQQLMNDGSYANVADVNGNTYITAKAGQTKQAAFDLEFDNIGTYDFRVVELKPSEQSPAGTDTPGMTYSMMQAMFQVTVTDEDMDGALEASVRESANITVTDTPTGIGLSASFENTYKVGATNASVNIHKNLVNPANANIPLTEFRFDMIACDPNGVPLSGAQAQSVTASAQGSATFTLVLDEAGTYSYLISEQIPDSGRVGMTYSEAKYLFTVVVDIQTTGSETSYIVTEQQLVDLATGAPLTAEDGVYTASFENTYSLQGTQITIPYKKALIGRDIADTDLFQVQLVQTDGRFDPLAGQTPALYSMLTTDLQNISLSYDQVGTYHYKLTEVIPANAAYDAVLGKYVLDGVAYDSAQYHITVNVFDNGKGGLSAQSIIHKVGQAENLQLAEFTNEYSVTGEASVAFGGTKTLNGKNLVAGEFAFGLYSDSACTQPLAQTQNLADGTFSFPAITYTPADLDNASSKVFTYYIQEIAGNQGGMSYDTTVHTVTVTLSHANGLLVATPSRNHASVQIVNTYLAQPVSVTIQGSKVLSGDWTNVPNQQFRFDLFPADDTFSITGQTPVGSASVNGQQTFSMTLQYTDGQEGTYHYVLKEDMSNQASGISYDAGEYHITVEVSDPGEGALTATMTLYRPGTGNTASAVFTNLYTTQPIQVTLDGSKTLHNASTNRPMPMEADMFQFLVLENDQVITTGSNRADGTISFLPITYTEAGTHNYTVVEVAGSTNGIVYSQAQFSATVTVTDNGDGTLSAATDYNGTPIVFENYYRPNAAQVIFAGQKLLEGSWPETANKVFTFQLYTTDSTFTVTGDPLLTATNDAQGNYAFDPISYTVVGTHYYVLREELFGQSKQGVLYDSKQVHITVTVTDNGDGKLVAAVQTSDAQSDFSSINAVVTIGKLNFTNRYQPAPTSYAPTVQKEYLGDALKQFDFVLTLDGSETQIKHNDENGIVAFDALVFDAPGVYTLNIREQENTLWGLIRWDTNEYTITLHVEDDGAGQLFINEDKTTVTSIKGDDDLIFRNTHYDIITDKDVFLPGEPTVSIDGKVVEMNQILLYKVSYTNYDSVPVDLEISDKIPQHTAYVDGSADNGGILSGDTLHWQIRDLAPGATVTVSFCVKVTSADVTITNSANILEGENQHVTNQVTNIVPEIPDNPKTGDHMNPVLLILLMLSSAVCLAVLFFSRKRLVR